MWESHNYEGRSDGTTTLFAYSYDNTDMAREGGRQIEIDDLAHLQFAICRREEEKQQYRRLRHNSVYKGVKLMMSAMAAHLYYAYTTTTRTSPLSNNIAMRRKRSHMLSSLPFSLISPSLPPGHAIRYPLLVCGLFVALHKIRRKFDTGNTLMLKHSGFLLVL